MRLRQVWLPSALLLAGLAQAQDVELQIELMNQVGTGTSHNGDLLSARVLSPASLQGDIVEGIGSLEVNVVRETPVGSIDGTETLNGETFTVPAKNDPKSQAGAWKNNVGPIDITVSWNLTKP